MSEPITTTYRDVEIVYLEDPNRWRFTANGRERSAESLVKARESIDRALDTEKKEKPWKPFDAYLRESYTRDEYSRVKVTSVAEGSSYRGGAEVWVTKTEKDHRGHDKNKRSKESASDLRAICPENEALIAEIARLIAEREELSEKIRDAHKAMIPAELPKADNS